MHAVQFAEAYESLDLKLTLRVQHSKFKRPMSRHIRVKLQTVGHKRKILEISRKKNGSHARINPRRVPNFANTGSQWRNTFKILTFLNPAKLSTRRKTE